MLQRQIQFEGTAPAQPDPAVRLDVACFLGCLAPRAGAVVDDRLRRSFELQGYLSTAEKTEAVATAWVDRPVPVRSLVDAEALFDLDLRLDRVAMVQGSPTPETVAAEGLLAPFAVTIDGRMHEVSLAGHGLTLAEVAAHLNGQFDTLDVWVRVVAGEHRLCLRRSEAAGPGTLSVLTHPALGFHQSQHVAARKVGTAMGAALRQFFRMGGQRAFIISMGAPLPVLAPAAARADRLAAMLGVQNAGVVLPGSFIGDFPPPHIEARQRTGLTHLFGLEEVGMLVMPDLPDLTGSDDVDLEPVAEGLRPLAGFAACTPPVRPGLNANARTLPLPVCSGDRAAIWGAALARVTRFLESFRRDVIAVAAVPETEGGVDIAPLIPRSELLMLTAPFAVSPASDGLPGGAMGGDAVLVGHIARLLNSPAPHGSMAADAVQGVTALEGNRRRDLDMICRLEIGPRDLRYGADLTTDDDDLWRAATARRMMARLLKHAARMGDAAVFEPISDALMRRIAQGFEAILQDIQRAGGLRPGSDDPGYSVLCNRTNNPASERDQGRLRADVAFRAAVPIEMIRVSLPMTGGFRSDGGQP